MKLPIRQSHATRPHAGSGFTLIEIALSLAVIAFALVAIIGVLPLSLETQKQNREDTLIDHDANYFLDALRANYTPSALNMDSRGLDDLTNYVYEMRISRQEYDINTNKVGGPVLSVYTLTPTTPSIDPNLNGQRVTGFPLTSGYRIVGLLGTPKYIPLQQPPGNFISNNVVAYVRALSGSVTEKFPQTNENVRELSFGYRLTSEIVPATAPSVPPSSYSRYFAANFTDVRLRFNWPVLPRGAVGTGREIYRAQVGGSLVGVPGTNQAPALFFFQPSTYSRQ